ncbi:hypothetical protein BC826DRAFT_966611 [Russula brevipes]|nr:hypothetical protein BC826DRAFT_966611 [Russula brevipes]
MSMNNLKRTVLAACLNWHLTGTRLHGDVLGGIYDGAGVVGYFLQALNIALMLGNSKLVCKVHCGIEGSPRALAKRRGNWLFQRCALGETGRPVMGNHILAAWATPLFWPVLLVCWESQYVRIPPVIALKSIPWMPPAKTRGVTIDCHAGGSCINGDQVIDLRLRGLIRIVLPQFRLQAGSESQSSRFLQSANAKEGTNEGANKTWDFTSSSAMRFDRSTVNQPKPEDAGEHVNHKSRTSVRERNDADERANGTMRTSARMGRCGRAREWDDADERANGTTRTSAQMGRRRRARKWDDTDERVNGMARTRGHEWDGANERARTGWRELEGANGMARTGGRERESTNENANGETLELNSKKEPVLLTQNHG